MNTAFSFTRLALSSVNNLLKNISYLFLVQFYSSSGVTIQQNNILTKIKDLIAFIYYPLFSSMMKENQKLIVLISHQRGVVAHACNPATWRLGCLDGLRSGFLGVVALCRSGIRAMFGVNMGRMEESVISRLVKEKRTGPGWKHSKQKLPRQTVVGLHL